MKKIYMDYAATTPVDKKVIEEMLPFFDKKFGNPASIHQYGNEANQAIEKARANTAKIINAKPEEIIFTSGGTESDNLAIKGTAYLNKNKRNNKEYNIITTEIEHPAVLSTCKHLEEQGFKIKYLPTDKYGIVKINELKKSISKNTFLISIMFANNEIGTIEPIQEIGKIAKENNILLHTDAVQAIGKTTVDVKKQNIDLLALSSHKIYGPKGVGALYIKKGTKIQPLAHGGGHEKGLRSSTLNTPGIVGLGKACQILQKQMNKDIKYFQKLRDKLIKNILQIEETNLNGHPEKRLANNAHFRFSAIEGESLLLKLNEKGIAASTGSACSSKKLQASHVLLALGLKPEEAHGSLRLSIGRHNTKEEVEYVTKELTKIVKKLREMSPLWKK
jgi:cysteine desulfurase